MQSAKHLDYKHTVFGRVVGGLETLDRLEAVVTGTDDRPREDVTLLRVTVFVNPYEDEKLLAPLPPPPLKRGQVGTRAEREEAERADAARFAPQEERAKWFSDPAKAVSGELKPVREGVGKYLMPAAGLGPSKPEEDAAPPAKKIKPLSGGFGNFSGW